MMTYSEEKLLQFFGQVGVGVSVLFELGVGLTCSLPPSVFTVMLYDLCSCLV